MEPKSLEEVYEKIGFGKFHYLLIVICGILHMFESTQVIILAYLQPILKCVWKINLWEESFLVISVFVGIMIGSTILGRLSDMYGRKTTLLISSCCLGYLGLLCAGSPSIVWIMIIRTAIGFNIGGIMSSLITLVSELTPVNYRGLAVILIIPFWSIGSYIIIILCVIVVPAFGWNGFLAISSLLVFLVLPLFLWLPESPRFLLLMKKKEKALIIINRIASLNNAFQINDVIQSNIIEPSWQDLFHKNYISTTFISAYLWMTSGLTYYGMLLIVTVIDNTPRQCLQNMNTYHKPSYNFTSMVDDSCCTPITWSNSINSIISTTGEIVFIPVAYFAVDYFGRKKSLAIYYFIVSVAFILINVCMSTLAMSILLFTLRGAIMSCFNLNYIYTSEVFPTSIRSIALGLSSASARIGGMLSPLILNLVINNYSWFYGTIIFTCFNFLACIASLILPYETKDRPLFQTAGEFKLVPDTYFSK